MLFILSLGGLSAQATARRGNIYGITGMIIAVVVTAFGRGRSNWSRSPHVAAGVGVGALAGLGVSR